MEDLLTLKEVAQLLRISPQTLYKMLKDGSLSGIKIGAQWRFDRQEVRGWLKGQTVDKLR